MVYFYKILTLEIILNDKVFNHVNLCFVANFQVKLLQNPQLPDSTEL